jgi:hypothetical protein
VRDYVGDEWGRILYRHYNVPERLVDKTAKQSVLSFAPVETYPSGNVARTDEAKKAVPEVTAGQKRLRKVDTSGMAKLTSMFTKKPKPEAKE